MKRALLATALIIAGAADAVAYDPGPTRVRVPYPRDQPSRTYAPRTPLQAFAWQGGYLGAGIGQRWTDAAWTTNSINATENGGVPYPDVPSERLQSRAFRSSVYGGYNWQADKWVWGVEGDIGFATSRKVASDIPGTYMLPLTGNDQIGIETNLDGSLRLRGGILLTPALLLYATGGLALQQAKISASCSAIPVGSYCLGTRSETVSKTLAGYTVGGGAEIMLAQHWMLRGEYRYSQLGTTSHEFFRKTATDDFTGSARIETHTVTFGLGYKF